MLDEDSKLAMPHALAIRLAIGLIQGLALYALDRWKAGLIPVAYGAMLATAQLVPIAALGTLGAARRRTATAWLAAATAICAVIGGYALYADPPGQAGMGHGPPLPVVAVLFTAVALFILHHLILPADAEGRWRARYERYFDEGWKDAVRLGLAAAFVGALWLVLFLGAQLFKLIGLDFLQTLITKTWFAFPATTVFVAIAAHITDIRAGLVRGARTLALGLLSWLLPVLTLIAVGFLAALPFTGLQPLLATKTSSGIMLAACAALIVLINATYQDGEADGFPPAVLKWVTRIAAVALAPLALVAADGVWLRIGQHGLTPERIYAGACVVVAGCYAAGYLWAAVTPGAWMKRLETSNWITAQVAVALLLALFSPLLDPARISVASQVARLESGQAPPKAFDYQFLRFRSGRWGAAALKRLAAGKGEPAEMAQAMLRQARPWEKPALTPTQRIAAVRAVGAPLPPSFLSQVWTADADPGRDCTPDPRLAETGPATCPALVTDLDDTPGPEVVVFYRWGASVYSQRNGLWTIIGTLAGGGCPGDREAVQAGRAKVVATTAHALELDGRRLSLSPSPPGKP